jgi:16S rRNA processing protein RimM
MVETFSFPTDKYILLGKVAKAHGIKGEVKLIAFSGEAKSITRCPRLTLISPENNIFPDFDVLKARIGKKEVIARLEGINDRNHAEELVGCGILALKEDLPSLEGDTFYLHELEGVSVKTADGNIIGTVEAFFDNGVQDIIVVRDGKVEYLIPLIPGMIVSRDKSSITIAPPPGLLEINSGESEFGNTFP